MDIVNLISQLVTLVAQFVKPTDPCPLCAARAANPVLVDGAIAAANVAADEIEKARFPNG